MSITKTGTLKAAKDLLEQHKREARLDKRKQNLDLLWKALEEMRVAGATRFNLADVGRKLESVGGPKTQSLRNASGVAFREVIALYTSAFERLASDPAFEEIERALSTVTNASSKHFFRRQAIQMRKLAADCQMLRVAISSMSAASMPSVQFSATSASHSRIPGWALDAIEQSLSPSWLSERGLTLSAEAGVRDAQNTCLFEPDFLAAMDELLKAGGRKALAGHEPL